jgi:peptide/nickel transport system permease protein
VALYIARRILALVPVLFGISVLTFALIRLVPGDPALALLSPLASPEDVQQLRRAYGLDEPLPVQFALWLGRLITGDLGLSIQQRLPVTDLLLARFQNTLILCVAALTLSTSAGVLAGIVSAARPRSLVDRGVMALSLFGHSMPSFWLGMLLIVVFAIQLRWLPAGGMFSLREGPSVAGTLQHLILPALTLALVSIGVVARLTRSAMLEALGNDYVRTARGKGLPERAVLWRHALRTAALPVVTIVGAQVGFLLGGAVLTETVFAWPGIGLLMYQAISTRDLPVIQGGVFFVAMSFGLVNLLVDVAYGFLDPRIRAGS